MVSQKDHSHHNADPGKLDPAEKERILDKNFAPFFGDSAKLAEPVQREEWLDQFKKAGKEAGLRFIE